MLEHHYTIYGKVQGVGFRYFVKEKADILNIKGFVKNSQDNNKKIEILAQHENQKVLDEFEDWLKIGPSMSSVEKIKKEKQDKIIKKYNDFQILS
ncbi:MAG: acylphosphatase [Candidatus Woesearchaeota archaeon]|jgi:acylphosphatase